MNLAARNLTYFPYLYPLTIHLVGNFVRSLPDKASNSSSVRLLRAEVNLYKCLSLRSRYPGGNVLYQLLNIGKVVIQQFSSPVLPVDMFKGNPLNI